MATESLKLACAAAGLAAKELPPPRKRGHRGPDTYDRAVEYLLDLELHASAMRIANSPRDRRELVAALELERWGSAEALEMELRSVTPKRDSLPHLSMTEYRTLRKEPQSAQERRRAEYLARKLG